MRSNVAWPATGRLPERGVAQQVGCSTHECTGTASASREPVGSISGGSWGVSEATVSRAAAGTPLPATGKALELAALFVRLYRALDAIAGGDDTLAARWIRNPNEALGMRPAEAIATIAGLAATLDYLDARRALV